MRPWIIGVLVCSLSTLAVAEDRSPAKLAQLLASYDRGDRAPATVDAIDHAAGQVGAIFSRLFWYTDLDAAKAAAREQHKPILSLRLLGQLDEEMSCANSRFFRKMLYSDPQITKLLRERYVLHWESLRPVPILTIDFGNGRTIQRTITGNSIHYLLLPDGRLADALPGMIDAATFERETTLFADLAASGPTVTDAALADYRDVTLLRLANLPVAPPALVRGADKAGRLAGSKSFVERAPLAATRNPSQIVKEDTELNQHTLRPQIIRWIAAGQAAGQIDLSKLNDRIYTELFLAPLNDPLMGLDLPDEFALVNSPKRMQSASAVQQGPPSQAVSQLRSR